MINAIWNKPASFASVPTSAELLNSLFIDLLHVKEGEPFSQNITALRYILQTAFFEK